MVVLTTSTAKAVHDGALAAGADKVFVKPESADALLAIAAEVIDRGVAYRQSRGAVFGDHAPASTLLFVAGLADPRWMVEIEAEAVA